MSRFGWSAEEQVVARTGPHQLVRGSLRHGLTTVDDDDAVGDPFRLIEVVGGQHDRHPVGREVGDDLADQLTTLEVDTRRRFVEEGDVRSADQGQREREALLLTSREPAERRTGPVVEADPPQELSGLDRPVEEPGVLAQDLRRPDTRRDAARLQHQADPASESPVVTDGVEAQDGGGSVHRTPVALEVLDGRRLAGAVRAEDDRHVVAMRRERQAVDGNGVAVPNDQVVDHDRRRVAVADRAGRRADQDGSDRPALRSGVATRSGPSGRRRYFRPTNRGTSAGTSAMAVAPASTSSSTDP